jgi:tetratricopeptide (TPR) repeat protein
MTKKKKHTPAPVAPASPAPITAQPISPAFSIFSRPWLPSLILGLAAFIVYGLSVQNGFVFFDDDKAILYNRALQNPSLLKFFSGQNLGMYAPLTWMAYGLGSLFSGKEAWGYHLLALLLHAGNAILVYQLLGALLNRPWLAFATALLFAVHPMQAEAVCWAAAMSTVLFTTFYLLSAYAYVRFVKTEPTRWPLYATSMGFFVLACLSKSAAVTLPLLLLAFDFCIFKKLERKSWLSKIPYLLFSLAFGFYTFTTREAEGHNIQAASEVFNFVDRFLMVCQTLLFYPVKLLLPIGYSVAYPFVKTNGAWDVTYWAAPLLVLGIIGLIWWKLRNQYDHLLAIALYFLPLTVMLPFRTVGSFELRSDRYVYFSSVGLFLLLALLAEKLEPKIRNAGLAAVAVILGFLAFQQAGVWKEGVALFKNCVDKTPESALCQCNLAYNELISLDFNNSVTHYTEALKYDPSTVEAYNGRGQAYLQLRKFPEALEDFSKAIQAGISTPKLYMNRGKCLVILNRPKEAIPDLTQSLKLEPKSFEAYYFRAVAREKTEDMEGAIQDYTKALELNPDYLEALVNRGLDNVMTGRYQEAIDDYTKAIQLNPNLEMIWNNRAYAYLKKGDPGNGVADAEKAISINKKYAKAYQTRGFLYQAMGQMDKANDDFQTAAQLGLK